MHLYGLVYCTNAERPNELRRYGNWGRLVDNAGDIPFNLFMPRYSDFGAVSKGETTIVGNGIARPWEMDESSSTIALGRTC